MSTDTVYDKKDFCELCGITNDRSPLEIDHILPRALGGANGPSNLQTICVICHKEKTKKDVRDIAEMRQKIREERGERHVLIESLRKIEIDIERLKKRHARISAKLNNDPIVRKKRLRSPVPIPGEVHFNFKIDFDKLQKFKKYAEENQTTCSAILRGYIESVIPPTPPIPSSPQSVELSRFEPPMLPISSIHIPDNGK